MMRRSTRKLAIRSETIRRQTIRVLQDLKLGRVPGGSPDVRPFDTGGIGTGCVAKLATQPGSNESCPTGTCASGPLLGK